MAIGSVLTFEDLQKIAEFIGDNGYSDKVTIVVPVRNKETLARINDDFFYRNNNEGTPPDVDEIKVTVGGVNFKYVIEKEGE